MTTQIKRRRGTTTQHASFTGAEAELTVDTDKSTVVVHDGSTAGGHPLAKASEVVAKSGDSMTGDLSFGDNDKAIFGAGSDLQIYHDGSDSYIDEVGSGVLKVRSNGTGIDFESTGGETLAQFVTNGAATLYYNNFPKLATTSTGVDVTGTITTDVTGGDNELRIATTTSGNPTLALYANGAGAHAIAFDRSDLALTFTTVGSSERMRIDSNGRVGIGTSSPNSILHLLGVDPKITLGVSGAAERAFLQYNNTTSLLTLDSDGGTTFATNNTEAMRITSTGSVGIGTSSPSRQLTLYGSAPYMAFQNATTGATTGDGLQIQMAGNDAYIWNYENSFMAFGTNGSEAMRIDSSGRALVNLTGPVASSSAKLQVSGTSAPAALLNRTNDGDQITFHVNGGAAVGSIGVGHEATGDFFIKGGDANGVKIIHDRAGGHSVFRFFDNNSSLRSFYNSVDGGVDLGVGSQRWRNLYLSNQAYASYFGSFGDTDTNIYFAGSDQIRFINGGSETMRITSAGSVGIGTSSPSAALDLRGEAVFGNGTDGLKLSYSAGNSTGIIDTGFTSTGLEFRTGNSFAAIIDSSGRVGINNSSPTATLDVNGTIKLDGNYPVGTGNVALGDAALDSVTTGGNYNTATGGNALTANTSGNQNAAFGFEALRENTTGYNNTAVGLYAGLSNTTGLNNVAVGTSALQTNTTANYNTAVGYQAGYSNTTGYNNAAFGNQAFYSNTTGALNTALGDSSLSANTTGVSNTAVGRSALGSNTTANYNTAVGYQTGYSNTTGTRNNHFGRQSGYTNQTGSDNTYIGDAVAYFATGSHNTGVGSTTLQSTTTGQYNTAIGSNALYSNTTASNNTAVGYQAGYANTTGTALNAFGYKTLDANTTGNANSAFGGEWLGNSTAALSSNTTGNYNSAFGTGALANNTTAGENTALGYQAAYTSNAEQVTAVGYRAGYVATGVKNTFLGAGAGNAVTTGTRNTVLGRYGGNQGGLDIRTSSNNIVLSDGDGNPRGIFNSSGKFLVGKTASGSVLNDGAELSSNYSMFAANNTGTNPTIFVGANGTSGYLITFYYGINTVGAISTNGTTTTYATSSDYRLKEDVQPMVGASDRVLALNPVNFAWKTDGSRVDGFLAHEAQAVVPEAVTGEKDAVDADGNPEYQGIDQSKLVPLLTAALQEALTEIADLKARVAALETN